MFYKELTAADWRYDDSCASRLPVRGRESGRDNSPLPHRFYITQPSEIAKASLSQMGVTTEEPLVEAQEWTIKAAGDGDR